MEPCVETLMAFLSEEWPGVLQAVVDVSKRKLDAITDDVKENPTETLSRLEVTLEYIVLDWE